MTDGKKSEKALIGCFSTIRDNAVYLWRCQMKSILIYADYPPEIIIFSVLDWCVTFKEEVNKTP
jgi:hypothetical protein